MNSTFLKNVLGSLIIFLSLGSQDTFSQNIVKGALKGTPDKYQGFFVFDTKKFPNVTYWETNLYELKWNNDKLDTVHVQRIGEKSSNFTQIDTRYLHPSIGVLCTINGYDASGTIITSDTWEQVPFGHDWWEEVCGATCKGTSYAYRVQVLGNYTTDASGNKTLIGNNHRVELWGDSEISMPEIGFYVPHYRYMSGQEMLALCGNYPYNDSYSNIHSPKHHGFEQGCPLTTDNHIGFKKLSGVTNNDQIYDMDNNQLFGDVWKIQKTLGFWGGESDYNRRSDVISGNVETFCGNYTNSITGLTDYANTVLSLSNTLLCNGSYAPNPAPGQGVPQDGLSRDYISKKIGKGKKIMDDRNPNTDLFEIMELLSGNQDIDGFENTTGVPWWPSDSILRMSIYKLDVSNPNEDISNAVKYFKRDSLYAPNGSPVNTTFTLDKGLYAIDYLMNDGLSFPLIFEVFEKTTPSYALSNYLTATIFPVPINSDGSYSVDFDANATIKFTYQVYDDHGNNYFERKFVMHKGHERTVKIRNNNLPSGILFHKFVFEDNSEINMTTIKE